MTDASGNPTSVPLAKMRELLDVSRELAVTVDLDHLLPLICHGATRILGADRCSLFLYDSRTRELWTKVALGADEIRMPSTAGIAGLVFSSRELLSIPDAYADSRFNRSVDLKTGYVTRNLLTLPVLDLKGEAVAVLQVLNKLSDAENSAGAFTRTDELLAQLLADQVGVAIQRYHLQQRALEAATLQREMDLARRVQVALLPKSPPEFPGWKVAGWARPASTTGGDVYDLWVTGKNQLALLVADATGHGIAPALVVSQARALVRVLADDLTDPQTILDRVNSRLANDLEPGMFVTAFLALASGNGKLSWCSAGHGPVLVRRDSGGPVDELPSSALPLGVLPTFEAERGEVFQMAAGGFLAVATDGISECWSPGREQFEVHRFRASLESWRVQEGPASAISALSAALDAWQGPAEQGDDQTVVLLLRE